MPVCPKCGEEIAHLTRFTKVWHEYKFSIDEEGNEQHEFVDSTVDGDNDEFECPECGILLFEDIEEAEKFLKGELSE